MATNQLDTLIPTVHKTTTTGRFQLSDDERRSAVWLRLMDFMEARLHVLREQNDSVKLDQDATQRKRGRIQEIRFLRALDKPAPTAVTDDSE